MIPGVANSQQALEREKDPVDSILLSKSSFEQALDSNLPQINVDKGLKEFKKVVETLISESSTLALLELVRKLNAR